MWNKYKLTKKEAIRLWQLTKANGKRMYDGKEIAQMLGVDRRTIYRWVSST